MSGFEVHPAKRQAGFVRVGVIGCSGSGKTNSALRMAVGMQRVVGGDIFLIDTEGNAQEYADEFSFMHLAMEPPFHPSRYIDAIRHCEGLGAKVVIVDSGSHAHEGNGGILDWHDELAEEMAKKWGGSPEKYNHMAWGKPKKDLTKLLLGMQSLRCNLIMCLRSKEKTRPEKKNGRNEIKQLGWMPICSDEVMHELRVRFMLTPGCDGVPEWQFDREGERAAVRRPKQFRELFDKHRGNPLSEELGEAMARWAAGGAPAKPTDTDQASPPADGEWRFPSGKYAGKTVRDVPDGYLSGLIDKGKEPLALFEGEMERRIREGEP